MRIISGSAAETERAGAAIAEGLRAGQVVALRGGLGAGKTCFVRGLCRGLGYTGRVTSPTYTLVNEYTTEPPVFHFDLYRLRNAAELFDIGWEDYLDRNGICVVEWSERAGGLLPEDAVTVEFIKTEEETREIAVSGLKGKLRVQDSPGESEAYENSCD